MGNFLYSTKSSSMPLLLTAVTLEASSCKIDSGEAIHLRSFCWDSMIWVESQPKKPADRSKRHALVDVNTRQNATHTRDDKPEIYYLMACKCHTSFNLKYNRLGGIITSVVYVTADGRRWDGCSEDGIALLLQSSIWRTRLCAWLLLSNSPYLIVKPSTQWG